MTPSSSAPVVLANVKDTGRPVPQSDIEPLSIPVVVTDTHGDLVAPAVCGKRLSCLDQQPPDAQPAELWPDLKVVDLYRLRKRTSSIGSDTSRPPDHARTQRFITQPSHQVGALTFGLPSVVRLVHT